MNSTQMAQYPSQPLANAPNDPIASGPSAPQHKRVYQACIPCRRRKVKCDLGSVDNPGDPPCVRCRRESKECYFSATRRKRKTTDGPDGSADGNELDDDYLIRNGRKRLYSDTGHDTPGGRTGFMASSIGRYMDEPQGPMTPGGNIGRTQPLRRPNAGSEDGRNVHMENYEAQEVMRREVYNPHDALDLLYKAATNRYAFVTLISTQALTSTVALVGKGTARKGRLSKHIKVLIYNALRLQIKIHTIGQPKLLAWLRQIRDEKRE